MLCDIVRMLKIGLQNAAEKLVHGFIIVTCIFSLYGCISCRYSREELKVSPLLEWTIMFGLFKAEFNQRFFK